MRNYDTIDPVQYDTRSERIPRERYLRDHWHPLIADAIIKYCQDNTVLDLGCGTGSFTTMIGRYAKRVLGIDSSQVMLTYAKSKDSNLNLALADAHLIPIKTDSVDTIVCIGLFEYIDRARVLLEIHRVLKADGICIMQCPNKYSAARMPAKVICKLTKGEYSAQEPSYREMLGLFERNGFEVIDSKMDDGLIWLPDFADIVCGKRVYLLIERLFKIFNRNPFSNVMLFVGRKTGR